MFSVYFPSEFLHNFLFFVFNGIFVIIGKSKGIPFHFILGYLNGPIDRDLGFYGSAVSLGFMKTPFSANSNNAGAS